MKYLIHCFLIALLPLGFLSCNNTKNEEAKVETEPTADGHHDELPQGFVRLTGTQAKTIGLEIKPAERLAIGTTIRVTGKLDVPPQNQISVSAPFAGFVRWTDVLQGMRVKKGQRLATIYNPDLLEMQKRLAQARADEQYLKKELDRQTTLRAEEINSQKTLERVRADYQSARAEAEALARQVQALGLGNTSTRSTYDILAPISGYISRVEINIGKQAATGELLFEIVNLEHLHAELFVFERDATKIKVGQKIRFSLPGEKEAARTATVYLVGRTLEPDRTIRVHGHLDTEDEALIPGLFIQGAIETDTGKFLSVPDQAIVRNAGKTFVFVPAILAEEKKEAHHDEHDREDHSEDEGQTFRMAEVKIGATELGYTQVTPLDKEGIDNGIVTKGAFYLLSTLKQAEGGGEEGHGH